MSKRVLQVAGFMLLLAPLMYLGCSAMTPQVAQVTLWNGNKSSARQVYERAVLEAALEATRQDFGGWALVEDKRDLPAAEEEAGVFRELGFDVFGTVAGNPKLDNENKQLIPIPLMKGLLGYRLLIIREEDQARFAAIRIEEDLKQLRLGIPATWADAGLFRHNGYAVSEGGSFDELFIRLAQGEFDYVAFGANEIDNIWAERAARVPGLARESELLLYYPFPVVFYVHPAKTHLAQRLTRGLEDLKASGELDQIFHTQLGDPVKDLHLRKRRLFSLNNPHLPESLATQIPPLFTP